MEAIERQERYEYVQVKPAPVTAPKWADMSGPQREAWENYICLWTWRAVESLIALPDFNPSLKAIAARLGISLTEAVEAVEGLEFIGIIRRTPNGGIIRSTMKIDLYAMQIPHREVARSQLLISAEINSRILDFENVRIANFVIPSSRSTIKALVTAIEKYILEAESDGLKNPEEVFGINFAVASLSPAPKQKLETSND